VPVHFSCRILEGKPAILTAEDDDGNSAIITGKMPEPARSRELVSAEVSTQLYKTGGTPFKAEDVRAKVDRGLSLPISEINAMRRSALAELTAQRSRAPERRSAAYKPPAKAESRRTAPELIIDARSPDQISDRMLSLAPPRIYLPITAAKDTVRLRELAQVSQVAVVLPRISWDEERPSLELLLSQAALAGVREAVVGNIGLMDAALERGFTLRGDYGLNITNSHSLYELKRLGFASATVSFELTFPRIRDLEKPLDCEFIAYGRLPLMITEQCIVKNKFGSCRCDENIVLTDRTGESFPILRESDHRNGIYNAHMLWLADKEADWKNIGLSGARLMFTTESARECEQVFERYLGSGNYEPKRTTRGLYYRGSE